MTKLNKPSGWKKQVNPNTKRMKALMRDVRSNIVRLTRNSKDLDEWMEKLAPYTASNCFVTGAHADQVREMVNQIAGVVDQTSLPSGANAEIVKGTMAEACMTMVANVGEDIKSELQRIAVESYNAKNTPAQTAQLIGERIDSLSRSRCQAIARTETCRAANISNYLNAKEMGAKSYSVICNEGCCEYCQDEYGTDETGGVGDTVYDIEDTDNLPPLHPNCRCTPVWSMDPPPGSEGETGEGENTDETESTDETKIENEIPQNIEAKLDNFGGIMENNTREHMQFFTENSNSQISGGTTGTVKVSGEQRKFMKSETKKGNELHGTHNHPNDHKNYTMLSHEDVVDCLMGWNAEGYNVKSFSAENKRNRVSVVKLDNYGKVTKYNERTGVNVDVRMTVNGVFSTHVDEYHTIRSGKELGAQRLEYLREKRTMLRKQGVPSSKLSEKMEVYEKKADKLFSEKEYQKKIDNAYKNMIKQVNDELIPFGLEIVVNYKD